MYTSSFSGRRIKDPEIQIRDNLTGYKSTLNALSDAWSTVAATKEELSDVDRKIKYSKAYSSEKYADENPALKYQNRGMHRKYKKIKNKVVVDPVPHIAYSSWRDALEQSEDERVEKENLADTAYTNGKGRIFEKGNYLGSKQTDDLSFVPTRKLVSLENGIDFNEHHENGYSNKFTSSYNLLDGQSGLNSSYSKRPLLSKLKDSEALLRLKEKIKHQKDDSIESIPVKDNSDITLKALHRNDDPVVLRDEQLCFTNHATLERKEPLRRKVVTVTDVPRYKGFTAVDVASRTFSVDPDKELRHLERKARVTEHNQANSRNPYPIKKTQSKSPKKGKLQRVVAGQKPTSVITTTSWRIGQELAKQAIKQTQKVGDARADTSQLARSRSPRSAEKSESYLISEKTNTDDQHSSKGKSTSSSSSSSSKGSHKSSSASSGSKSEGHKDIVSKEDTDDNIDDLEDDKNDRDDDLCAALSESKALPEAAKEMLAEMELEESDASEEEEGADKEMPKPPTINVDAVKKSVKRKAPASKSAPQEDKYPKQKTRHYDEEEVKKYMQKKIAERKKKRIEEKKKQQKMKEEQQKKLEALYNKQKRSLRTSLFGKQKKTLQETFTREQEELEHDKRSQGKKGRQVNGSNTDISSRNDLVSPVDEGEEVDLDLTDPTNVSSIVHSNGVLDAGSSERDIAGVRAVSVAKAENDKALPPRGKAVSTGHSAPLSSYVKKAYSDVDPSGSHELEVSERKKKADRIAAIHATANALRERLDSEAKRLASFQKMPRSSVQPNSLTDRNGSRLYPPTAFPKPLRQPAEAEVFTGHLPGVGNLDEQAEIKKRTGEVEEAATKIQAMYRGYSVRQGLNWKLPSGETLQSVIRQQTADTQSKRTQIDPESYNSDFVGSTASLISEALGIENRNDLSSDISLLSDQRATPVAGSSTRKIKTSKRSETKSPLDLQISQSSRVKGKAKQTNSFLSRKKVKPEGDRYSVINIFARRFTGGVSSSDKDDSSVDADISLSRDSLSRPATNLPVPVLPADELYEQDFEDAVNSYESTLKSSRSSIASLTESVASSKAEGEETGSKALFDSPKASDIEEVLPDQDKDRTLTQDDLEPPSPRQNEDAEADNDPVIKSDHDDVASIPSSTVICTPPKSPGSLTEGSPDTEKGPVMSSTMREQTSKTTLRSQYDEKDTIDSPSTLKTGAYQSDFDTQASASKASVTEPTTTELETPSRHLQYSPGGLANKFQIELNYLESMDTSLLRINEVERLRAVALAQQETVSLAQVLKNRQQVHELDLDRMSEEAKEHARKTAVELEKARRAAADAATEAAKTLYEVRSETANTVKEAAQKLVETQHKAAEATAEAAQKVEEARKFATDAVNQAANRQMTDVEALTKSAASAAATSAVQAALQYHKEQLEQLRKEALERAARRSPYTTSSNNSSRSTPTEGRGSSTQSKSTQSVNRTRTRQTPTARKYSDDEFEQLSSRNSFTSRTISELREAMTPSASKSSVKDSEPSKSRTRGSSADIKLQDARYLSVSQLSIPPTAKESPGTAEEDSVPEELPSVASEKKEGSDGSQKEGNSSVTPRVIKVLKRKASRDSPNQSDIEEASFKVDELLSPMAEDDLDREFKMVLPSESHLRKSLERKSKPRRDSITSDNGTSSEENTLTSRPLLNKHGRPSSPFAGEDIFSQFTSEMVRQYVQEEEVRARHQAALLRLREKAIIDKTKAEMAWLELQKKSLRDKGADDLMPPLKKRQRGLWMKLQAEQSEIRKLREAYKAASQERKLMLYQQREIQKIQRTTQKLWSKVRTGGEETPRRKTEPESDAVSESPSEQQVIPKERLRSPPLSSPSIKEVVTDINVEEGSKHSSVPSSHSKSVSSSTVKRTKNSATSSSASEIKEDLPASDNTIESASEIISEKQSHQSVKDDTVSSVASDQQDETQVQSGSDAISAGEATEATESSLLYELKKLKYKTSDQYLAQREAKLKHRRKQFESLLQNKDAYLDRKKKIDEEEMRLKLEIRDAINYAKKTTATTNDSSSRESSKRDSDSATSQTKKFVSSPRESGEKLSESDSSITEDVKSQAQDTTGSEILEEDIQGELSQKTESPTGSIPEEYQDDTFEDSTKVTSRTHSKFSKLGAKDGMVLSSWNKEPIEEAKSEDEISITEAASDVSDIKKRVKRLEEQLRRRRKELDRIRRKRDKDILRTKEQKLKQELQAVEQLIHQENKENIPQDISCLEKSVRKALQSPRILSPRGSLTPLALPDTPKGVSADLYIREHGGSPVSSLATKDREKETEGRSVKSDASRASQSKAGKSVSSPENSGSLGGNEQPRSGKLRDLTTNASAEPPSPTSIVDGTSISDISQQQSIKDELPKESADDSISEDSELKTASNAEDTVNSQDPASSIEEEYSQSRHSSISSVISEKIHASTKSAEALDDKIDGSISENINTDNEQDIYDDDFFETGSASTVGKANEEIIALSDTTDKVKRNVDGVKSEHSALDVAQDVSRATESEHSKHSSVNDVSEEIESADEISEAIEISATSELSHSKSSVSSAIKGEVATADLSKSEVSSLLGFHKGQSVRVDGSMVGTIRFLGKVPFSPVAVAGVELKSPYGTNDGSFQDKRYFSCLPDHGLFIPISKISHLEPSSQVDVVNVDLKSTGAKSTVSDEEVKEGEKQVSSSVEIQEYIDDVDEVTITSEKSETEPERSTRQDEGSSVKKLDQQGAQEYSEDFDQVEFSLSERKKGQLKSDKSRVASEPDVVDTSRRSKTGDATDRNISDHSAPDTSHFSEELQEIIKSAANSVEAFLSGPDSKGTKITAVKDDDSVIGSDLESEADIPPEPKRVDLSAIADNIAGHIFDGLLKESFGSLHDSLIKKTHVGDEKSLSVSSQASHNSLKDYKDGVGDKKQSSAHVQSENTDSEKEKPYRLVVADDDSISEELSEAYITPTPRGKLWGEEKPLPTVVPSIDNATSRLLGDAVSHMIKVAKSKALKLKTEKAIDSQGPDATAKSKSLRTDNDVATDRKGILEGKEDDVSPPDRNSLEKSALDSALLTEKLNELKTMHRELDDLLGAESDEDDDFIINQNNEILSLPDADEDLASTLPDFFMGEPVIYVPYSVEETNELVERSLEIVFAAMDQDGNINATEPDDGFFEEKYDEDDFEGRSKYLFKQLTFELSKDIVKEIQEFRNIQAKARPPWMKPERRPFSRFIHQSHPLAKDELVQFIQNYVCVCLGLKPGRPTLDLLKRRLPLNVSKKDYVDAILVEELREDEPQWVNYDEDELRVKFQVTDAILDSLIDETANVFQEIFANKLNS